MKYLNFFLRMNSWCKTKTSHTREIWYLVTSVESPFDISTCSCKSTQYHLKSIPNAAQADCIQNWSHCKCPGSLSTRGVINKWQLKREKICLIENIQNTTLLITLGSCEWHCKFHRWLQSSYILLTWVFLKTFKPYTQNGFPIHTRRDKLIILWCVRTFWCCLRS